MNNSTMRGFASGLAVAVIATMAVLALGDLKARPQTESPGTAAASDRAADRGTLRELVKAFVTAFERGDAAAAAGFMTDGAETMAADGTGVQGRAAIQKAFAELFAKHPKHSVQVQQESLRFLSRDTALDEGKMMVKSQAGESALHRYVFLFVREDGRWRIAFVRNDESDQAELADLEWLIGSWTTKRDDVEAQTTYEWSADKSFIKTRFSVREKGTTVTGEQVIGVDPVTGTLRTWTFEAGGGIGEGTCTRDGKNWVFENTATLTDGRVMTATNVMTPIDKDSFIWHPQNMTMDGERVGNLPPVKAVRVKARQ